MVHLFTSFTYNDPCQLVKAGRVLDPKIQKKSYIYKLNIYQQYRQIRAFLGLLLVISKTSIPLEKVGWGISVYLLFKY